MTRTPHAHPGRNGFRRFRVPTTALTLVSLVSLVSLALIVVTLRTVHPPARSPSPADTRSRPAIVSLAPALTETFFALGLEEHLAGRSRFCLLPEAAGSRPVVGGIHDPDLEAILALHPDAVWCADLTPRIVRDRIEALGIPVTSFPLQTIEDFTTAATRLIEFVGAPPDAHDRLEKFQRELDLASASTPLPKDAPTAVVLLGFEGLFSAGHSTFPDELLRRAGARNLAAVLGSAWPQLDPEWLLDANPDLIFVADSAPPPAVGLHPDLQLWARDPRWSHLAAVRNDRIHVIHDSLLTIPGPRMVLAARELRRHVLAVPHTSDPQPR